MSKIKIDKNIAYVLSIIGFIAGIVLCYLSFYMPPKGIIDNSVLMFCGQMLSFTAAALGFSMHFETKFEKMSMEINDSKQQKPSKEQ
jgi:hypothetical protein